MLINKYNQFHFAFSSFDSEYKIDVIPSRSTSARFLFFQQIKIIFFSILLQLNLEKLFQFQIKVF
jgi:hypothetical protein